MKEQENKTSSGKDMDAPFLSGRKLFYYLKKFFIPWIIAAAVIVVFLSGMGVIKQTANGTVSATVNFGFDGIEAGLDPSGNKFNSDSLKSKNIISESLKEMNIEGDTDKIYSGILISGVVPSNIIDRITSYTPIYDSKTVASSKDIQDTSYYPTQYTLTINCKKAGLSQKESEELLNKMTEKYEEYFYDSYGYNKSLETAVTSIDYNDYDYIDALTVFDASLGSLKDYIDDLSSKDTTRYRSDETGYTFADLSKSIDTIRTEDLDWISSYITLHNVTKDKKNLIANYKFKIEEYERTKKIYEERLKAVEDTISGYEKNSILIFSNATDGTNAALNQSSDTYDNLITEKVKAQTNLSSSQQRINLYQERIKSLESGKSTVGSEKIVEEKLAAISDKVQTLIDSVNNTATDYYKDVLFTNAYKVLTPASSSFMHIVKDAAKDSMKDIAALELLLLSVYIIVSCAAIYVPENVKEKIERRKSNPDAKKKNKKK